MNYLQHFLKQKHQELDEAGKLLNKVETFTARIYVGFYDTENDILYPSSKAERICQEYVEEVGLCVNLQDTCYQYGSGGNGGVENGVVVELIHYPRFPLQQPEETITIRALNLAEELMEKLHQKRVSVVTTTDTYTLQNPNHEKIE